MKQWQNSILLLSILIIGAVTLTLIFIKKSTKSASNVISETKIVGESNELSGKIIFIEERGSTDTQITQFDTTTQKMSTIFRIPKGGWIYGLDANFQGTHLVISYSPPNENRVADLDRNGLYLLEMVKRAKPQLIIGNEQALVYYYDPIWSPDGSYLYYLVSDVTNRSLTIQRLSIATNQVEVIAENALYPRPSPNGESLIYLHVNPETLLRSLIIVDLDKANPKTLIPEQKFSNIDLPFFSNDGQWVYFSAPNKSKLLDSLWRVFGFAYAHGSSNNPASWWQISIDGNNKATKITKDTMINYYGKAAIEGENFGFTSDKGFYIANEKNATLILQSRALREFAWIPNKLVEQ